MSDGFVVFQIDAGDWARIGRIEPWRSARRLLKGSGARRAGPARETHQM